MGSRLELERLLPQMLGGGTGLGRGWVARGPVLRGHGGCTAGAPPTLTGQSLEVGRPDPQEVWKPLGGAGLVPAEDVLVSNDSGPVPCPSTDFSLSLSLHFFSLQPLLGKACL